MTDDALASLDATAQAELVRRGEVKPLELVEAAIARAERVNPQLNAVIHPLYDKARAAAVSTDLPHGPFRGVPFLVKDAVCHTAGDPYHCGMRVLKEHGYRAKTDTELARRFRAAGFVFVGKTNTPELALSATTEPLAYGATRNPWNTAHSTGGSSGGSAAAVAAGIAPVAHANDMGGSIRVPASCCGLVGLKPTRARATLAPDFGEFWGPLTHEHVLTRSVRDSAAVLDCIAGAAIGDPYTAPPPPRPFAAEVGTPPGALRIGFVATSAHAPVHAECAGAALRTAELLVQLGHRVAPARIEALERMEVGPWIPAAVAQDVARWSRAIGREIQLDELEPFNAFMVERGRELSAVAYVAAAEAAFAWSRELQAAWAADIDVLMTPTLAVPPPPLGWVAPNVPFRDFIPRLNQMTAFAMQWNVTGQPAISLPLAESSEGLPIGVQFVAAFGREDVLIRLASQLEAAQPWAGRRPRVHA